MGKKGENNLNTAGLIATSFDAMAMHIVFILVGSVCGWHLHRLHTWIARKFSA